jgi:hypothetical protein
VILMIQLVKRKSSPGIPFVAYGSTNEKILDNPVAFEALVRAIVRRIKRLVKIPLDHNYDNRRSLMEEDLADLIRLFVKQEPHKEAKVLANRWRLIWSISLVDQVVERFFWNTHAKREIAMWEIIPSKPGMGAADYQLKSLGLQVEGLIRYRRRKNPSARNGPLCDRDVVASDMELAEWMLFSGVVSMLIEYDYPLESDFWRGQYARHKLGCRPIVSLSNGEMYETLNPGLMLSGRFVTSFLNSRVYTFISALRGERAMCMGDDTIESNVSDMSEAEIERFYELVGLPTEIGLRDTLEGLEFCSLLFHKDGDNIVAHPKRWGRSLYRLLSGAQFLDESYALSSEAVEQFEYETRHMPEDWQVVVYPLLREVAVL